MSSNKKSIIFYNGFREKSYCGYCKKDNASYSNGMWASTLTVQAYQELIDRGWRRSGKYCYKSSMDKTCCPLYTIRCEALHFELSKSQKKILKKVTKFLKSGESDKSPVGIEQGERELFMKHELHDVHVQDDKMQVTNPDQLEEQSSRTSLDVSHNSDSQITNKDVEDDKMQVIKSDQLEEQSSRTFLNVSHNSDSQVTNKEGYMVGSINVNYNFDTTKETKKVKQGEGANPNLPKCKKKKCLRREKKIAKNPNCVITTSAPQHKSLENFLAENDSVSIEAVKKLRIKLIKLTPSSSSFEDEYAVYKLYQTTVHGDTDERCSREQFIRFLGDSPLRVSLVKTGTEAFIQTFTAGASLFAKYQMAVHNEEPEDCDMDQYLSFLVDSPLQAEKADHPDHPGYGSFHQQYWLGDKLIAVGVIDILPKCVSSVYLFYDPDYHHMVLGTYSSLREICLVRQLNSMSPDLKYYYMGFYIHSCTKMRYKAKFRPSYLLCPLRYTWHAIDKCIKKLENAKYSIFNESDDLYDDDVTLAIEHIPVLYGGTLMTYSTYKTMGNLVNQDELITEYTKLVGPKLAKQLIYCFLD